jgi:hypothetical protein
MAPALMASRTSHAKALNRHESDLDCGLEIAGLI